MTREEEIKQQANIYTNDSNNYAEWSEDGGWSDSDDREFVEKAFIEGAKWADKTMMEKVCNWLKQSEADYYKYDAWKGDYVDFDVLIESLRKAMEE